MRLGSKRAVLGVLLVTSAPAHAVAQATPEAAPAVPLAGPEVTLAETLYREGRKLMAEQRYAEASVKFAESHRLDPATGTLLNLATCHEAQGKYASAWLAFSEALRAARREQREDRVRFAEERIAALDSKLSRLAVQVPPGTPADVVVRVDGVVIGPAAYGVAAPIDPGKHRVEASAPGRKSWTSEVVIGAAGDSQIVTVPALELAPAAEAAPSEPRPVVAPIEGPPPPPARDAVVPTSRPIPVSVYVSGTVTVLLTAGAVVSGIAYLDKKSDYASMRDDPDESEDTKLDTLDEAKTLGWVNAGLVAGAAIGAGLTLFLYSSRPERPRSALVRPRVGGWASPGSGGLTLSTEF